MSLLVMFGSSLTDLMGNAFQGVGPQQEINFSRRMEQQEGMRKRHCSAQQEKLEGAAGQEQQHFKGMMRIVYAQTFVHFSRIFRPCTAHGSALSCCPGPGPGASLTYLTLSHHTPAGTFQNPSTAPTRARTFTPMGVGVRGAPKTVGADDSEAGTCSHLHAQELSQAPQSEDVEQTHRAGRLLSAPPRSKRHASPVVVPIDEERSVPRRAAVKTTLRYSITSSIMALSSSFTGF